MKSALSAAEIASMSLPGLVPDDPNRVLKARAILGHAKLDSWPCADSTDRGGGVVYPIATMPAPWRDALMRAIGAGVPAVLAVMGLQAIAKVDDATPKVPAVGDQGGGGPPAVVRKRGALVVRCGRRKLALAVPDAAALTDRQRRVRDARAAILEWIDATAAVSNLRSAIDTLTQRVRDKTLRPDLLAAVTVANDRATDGRIISRATIMAWRAARADRGVDGLAPRSTADVDVTIPVWAPYLLAEHQRPSKPSLRDTLRTAVWPAGMTPPTYAQALGFLNKLSPFCREKGRYGPNAIKRFTAYTVRDKTELWPTAVYIGDGKTFRAKAQHPIHGQLFQPEVTTWLDAKSEVIVGWSVGIVENSLSVLAALSMAMAPAAGKPGGIPTIAYADLGKGFKNELLSAEITGFYARWGILEKHSRARNSQARGLIERVHQTYDAFAKRLPTYCGDAMDKDALRLIDKANKVAAKEGAPAPYTVTWREFVDGLAAAIDEYNRRPHSSLPKIPQPEGPPRHMCPLEAWIAGVEATGHKPMVVTGDDVADLARPQIERKVQRAQVSLFGHSYFAMALEAYDGVSVRVGFDVHDPGQVWVRDRDNGRLLAVAKLDGNARPYFKTEEVANARRGQVLSFSERGALKRCDGRMKRVDARTAEIQAEARMTLDLRPDGGEKDMAVAPLLPETAAAVAEIYLNIEALKTPAPPPVFDASGRPARFESDEDLARWVAAHPTGATEADLSLLRQLIREPGFCWSLDASGLDPQALRAAIA